ncbi:helix-turn-helix domain-containing protein [Bradyrhizobium barranii subsp. barranii]|uniref:Helix-turn-helix domain-containing protein n=1 Tax=Bradyrhizobium barranii subsp. barranii TaxID=2823807 RepID=A0A7Z0TQP9_9BRAD|nr:helix-turn-helix domain-containing protein [Bradyrhizobium barranii]UGX93682.1 helix-turn-helix domain-containing protein [Bradyrhizobium barranii subsp. barranii]
MGKFRSKTLVAAESEERDNGGMIKVEAQPIALSLLQAAELLGVHERHILNAVRSHELPAYQRGIAVRVLMTDLVDWVREHWKPRQPTKSRQPRARKDEQHAD